MNGGMMMLVQNVEMIIRPTPEELADEFWSLLSGDQARFFNRLGQKDEVRLVYQLEYVQQERLTKEGRRVMELIGESTYDYVSTGRVVDETGDYV